MTLQYRIGPNEGFVGLLVKDDDDTAAIIGAGKAALEGGGVSLYPAGVCYESWTIIEGAQVREWRRLVRDGKAVEQGEVQAEACMHRMRSPARRAFAAEWIAYRWRGALEPSIADGMRSYDAMKLIEKLGGFRPPKGGKS